jgi:hypothetical protein
MNIKGFTGAEGQLALKWTVRVFIEFIHGGSPIFLKEKATPEGAA